MNVGETLINGRYRLDRLVTEPAAQPEAWEVSDADGYRYLAKVWPFPEGGPDPVQRALWDLELRTLYRIGSSPGAESYVLRLRDAAVDRAMGAFVMVQQGTGFQTLSEVLASPATYPWLGSRSVPRRVALWRALRSIAGGLALLHRQQVLHRSISPESVYLDASQGPDTFRLGGFEWSIRLGSLASRSVPQTRWSSPPDHQGVVAHLPDTDWFAFGMLAARVIVNLEHLTADTGDDLHQVVLSEIGNPAKGLSSREVDLISHLIADDPLARTRHYEEISREIVEIERELAGDSDRRTPNLVLVVDPKSEPLIQQCQAAGMIIDPDDEFAAFNPLDPRHTSTLTSFVRSSVRNAVIHPAADPEQGVLVGGFGPMRLARWKAEGGSQSWDLAFCVGPASVSTGEGGPRPTLVPQDAIAVRTVSQAHNDSSIRTNATSWSAYLPHAAPAAMSTNQTRLVEFLRSSNQVELVIRDAEVFPYRVVSRSSDRIFERVVIAPRQLDDARPAWSRIKGGFVEHLLTELPSNKPDCEKVVLTARRDLRVSATERDSSWSIDSVNLEDRTVTLARAMDEFEDAPETGFVRTWGMAIGQVPLIERRSESIERVVDHTYLLQALTAPGFVYMDTGEVDLPVSLPAQKVDPPKRAVIEDVLRVRPIYALQGPPGTGKTTMVAWLLREVLSDDPVAQVLVTAQAHGALDVLRHRVASLFEDLPEDERPLVVRLGGREDDAVGGPGEVTAEVLARAELSLRGRADRREIEDRWLAEITEMAADLEAGAAETAAADFTRLVQRSANLTFCTTSAGDLAELAREAQSFDWSIIEEAGKAHGFDLALPLWSGHRWLLIGDHAQLPPYRYEDYKAAFADLQGVVDHLRAMQKERRGSGLVDVKWLQDWDSKSEDERAEAIRFGDRWLATFHQVFQQCQRAPGKAEPVLTLTEPVGAAAGMLSGQHRMHPDIGDLISKVFYDGLITNETRMPNGEPMDHVRHRLTSPSAISDRAIVWIDTPWAMSDPRFAETGEPDSHPYINEAEVSALSGFLERLDADPADPLTFAALSPYNRQRAALQARLRQTGLPAGLVPADVAYGGRGERERFAYTVDAFQGNQADVVAVSLVRNNTEPKEMGLGFLDRPRMNVLLSRAQRLLVLIGSWEFFVDQVSLIDREDSSHKFLHWAQVLDVLESLFESGGAVRLDAVELGFVS